MTRRLLDPDRQREQRRQSALLDRLEARYRPAFSREIARAMREIVSGYDVTGEVGTPRDHYDSLEQTFRRMASDAALVFGGRIIEQGLGKGLAYTFGDGGVGFAGRAGAPYFRTKENFAATMMRLALSYVGQEAIRRRITSISEATRAQVVAQVERGYRDGLGVSEIAGMISRNIPTISRTRGALISRTETHGAANFGADQAARETGLLLRKEWVSAEDERTRAAHRAADGQVVGMDDAFEVGGESLMRPGDPAGSAANTVNCRCGISHIVVDD